jgi:hypothetical protein
MGARANKNKDALEEDAKKRSLESPCLDAHASATGEIGSD